MLLDRERVSSVDGGRRPDPAYRTVVVPLDGDEGSFAALATACTLAAEGAAVVGTFVIEIPSELPLEAHMFEVERRAKETLAQARATVESFGLRFTGRVVRAHARAAAIVAEAERLDADVVVLAGQRRAAHRCSAPVFDRAVRTVLEDAACRVLLIAPPAGES